MEKKIHLRAGAVAAAIICLAFIAATPVFAASSVRYHASGSRVTRTGNASTWGGTVVTVSSPSLTVTTTLGQTYTVLATNAIVKMRDGATLPISNIEANDVVTIVGTLQGSVISATRVTDSSLERNEHVSGTISLVTGNTITVVTNDKGTVTVHLANGAVVKKNGGAASLDNLAANERVSAVGTWDQPNKALWTTDVRIWNGNYYGQNATQNLTNTANNGSVSISLSPYVTSLASGDSTTVTANAYDSDGITNVSIYVNGSLQQTCAVYNDATSGTCTLTIYGSNYSYGSAISVYAQLTDRYGNVASSATSTLTDENGTNGTNGNGSVSVSLSPYASALPAGASTTVTATASDPDGIAETDIYVNGSLAHTCPSYNNDTNATCTVVIYASDYSYGSTVSVYAKMADRYGNIVTSNVVTLTVQNNSNTANNGSVSISLSPYSSTLPSGGRTTVTANATDPDGITSLGIYVNGSLQQSCAIYNATSGACSFNIYGSSYANGSSVSIFAQMTDRYGNVASSATSTLTAQNAVNTNAINSTVSLSFSPYSSTLPSGASTTVTANAYDPDGITNVSVYVNGALAQSCSIASGNTNGTCAYTISASGYANGSTISVYAQTTDIYGNIATSATSSLAIGAGAITAQSITSGNGYSGSFGSRFGGDRFRRRRNGRTY
jgi:Bacterial Ig domain